MLGRDEVPLPLSQFEHLRDGLYRLTSALEDVDGDLAEDADYGSAFRHLYNAATELRGFEIEAARLR